MISPLVSEFGSDNIPIVKKIEEIFKKPPFNAGFGMYLYLGMNSIRNIFPNAEEILKDILSKGLREFDVYRLTENISAETMI